MSEIMKIIDARESKQRKKQQQQQQKTKTEKNKEYRSYSEGVRPKWFCWAFKLGFLHLICKTFLIFKPNLELTLSIILKERELFELKYVAVNCRCLKLWNLLSFLICSSILVLKWQVSPIELELLLTQINFYTRKNSKSSVFGSLCGK